MSTKPRNGRRFKLIAATALGLDALTFLVVGVIVVVVDGFNGALFVPLVVICVLGFLGWFGLSSPGSAGGCLLPFAFVGFWIAAFAAATDGGTLAWFLLFLVFWSLIPLIAAVLFLVARRNERPLGGPNA